MVEWLSQGECRCLSRTVFIDYFNQIIFNGDDGAAEGGAHPSWTACSKSTTGSSVNEVRWRHQCKAMPLIDDLSIMLTERLTQDEVVYPVTFLPVLNHLNDLSLRLSHTIREILKAFKAGLPWSTGLLEIHAAELDETVKDFHQQYADSLNPPRLRLLPRPLPPDSV